MPVPVVEETPPGNDGVGAGRGGTGEGWTLWIVPAEPTLEVKAKSAGSVLDKSGTLCPWNTERPLDSKYGEMAGPKAPLANTPTPKRPSKTLFGGFFSAADVLDRGAAKLEPGAAGDEGPLGPRPAGAPGPFELARLRGAATTVEATPEMLLPGAAPVAAEVTPVRTPVSSVEFATGARAPVVCVTMDEPAVVTVDVARARIEVTTLEPVWARSCETGWTTLEVSPEPARARVWVMLDTLAAPLTALLSVRVTTAVAVGVAEPASRVMFEALLVVCVTAFVSVAAVPASACAGAALTPGTGGAAPLGVWLALRTAVVVAPTLFTASVGGAAAFVTGAVAVGAGGEAGGFCAAVVAGVAVVACATVVVVACAAEEISCEAVPATLSSAPVTGAAALGSSASARVPENAHRTATIISRAIRRSAVHAEGLRALPSISLGCGGFALTVALYTRSPRKSSQIAAL
jgi:hypothetical protein